MTKPTIVTGCGRSGTHWLAHVLAEVLGPEAAAHEPEHYGDVTDVVVDARLRDQAARLEHDGHRVLHLVRDGRDVVRSLHRWYLTNVCYRPSFYENRHLFLGPGQGVSFEECCQEWRNVVDLMLGYPVIRLEDLTATKDPQSEHTLPHWTEWDDRTTETFWDICGKQMERMGYER